MLLLAASLLAACIPAQPHRNLVDSRATLPPTHLGAGGAVMLGRTATVGGWEIRVLGTELAPRGGQAPSPLPTTPDELRRVQPFVVTLEVERARSDAARVSDELSFLAYTDDAKRFVDKTSVGRCAEEVPAPDAADPLMEPGDRRETTRCFFVSAKFWDALFLAVRDAESGEARGFHLQATSH